MKFCHLINYAFHWYKSRIYEKKKLKFEYPCPKWFWDISVNFYKKTSVEKKWLENVNQLNWHFRLDQLVDEYLLIDFWTNFVIVIMSTTQLSGRNMSGSKTYCSGENFGKVCTTRRIRRTFKNFGQIVK